MTIPPSILLAEDDEDDVFFLHRALQKSGLPNPLIIARGGREAIEMLTNTAHGSRPGLILLDLGMPEVGGLEVLAWIRTRPELWQIPVVVFSTSTLPEDEQEARSLGAVDYRVKQCGFEGLVPMLQELSARWLSGTAQPTIDSVSTPSPSLPTSEPRLAFASGVCP